MIEDIQAAIPLGFFLSFMIGPVFFVLLETSIVKGFRAAVAFDLGVIIADIIFIFLAYFSSYQLLENLSNQPGLYIFGGTLLAVYGIIIFTKKANKQETETNLESILELVAPHLTEKHIVISTITGFSIFKIESIVGAQHHIIRAMPNT